MPARSTNRGEGSWRVNCYEEGRRENPYLVVDADVFQEGPEVGMKLDQLFDDLDEVQLDL